MQGESWGIRLNRLKVEIELAKNSGNRQSVMNTKSG